MVRSLTYRMRMPEGYRISADAPPWNGILGDFDAELADGVLTLRPRSHYFDIQTAQTSVAPLLSAWEAAEDIEGGCNLQFEFDAGFVEDRAVPQGTHSLSAAGMAMTSGRAHIVVVRPRNPSPPPSTFRNTELVGQLRARWRAARDGRRPLLGEVNYIFTALIAQFGGDRPTAARAMNVAQTVLNALAALTARQHPTEARKVDLSQPELNARELEWIQVVLPSLLMRAGEADPEHLPQITMAHAGYPPLDRPWHLVQPKPSPMPT